MTPPRSKDTGLRCKKFTICYCSSFRSLNVRVMVPWIHERGRGTDGFILYMLIVACNNENNGQEQNKFTIQFEGMEDQLNTFIFCIKDTRVQEGMFGYVLHSVLNNVVISGPQVSLACLSEPLWEYAWSLAQLG